MSWVVDSIESWCSATSSSPSSIFFFRRRDGGYTRANAIVAPTDGLATAPTLKRACYGAQRDRC